MADIPLTAGAATGGGSPPTEQVIPLPLRLLDPSPYQPRARFDEVELEELAASIAEHGLLQPVVARPVQGRYQLVAGERRVRAARLLGLEAVPALVRPLSDEQALEAALVENLQRADITPVELATAYRRLVEEFGYTQARIARQTGRSRAAVANCLRLLALPRPVLALLESGDLTEGHARALLALPYHTLMEELAEWAARNGATVRETERKVRALLRTAPGAAPPPARSRPAPDLHAAAVEEALRRHYGVPAQLAYRSGRGSLTLPFSSDEELERLLELLLPG